MSRSSTLWPIREMNKIDDLPLINNDGWATWFIFDIIYIWNVDENDNIRAAPALSHVKLASNTIARKVPTSADLLPWLLPQNKRTTHTSTYKRVLNVTIRWWTYRIAIKRLISATDRSFFSFRLLTSGLGSLEWHFYFTLKSTIDCAIGRRFSFRRVLSNNNRLNRRYLHFKRLSLRSALEMIFLLSMGCNKGWNARCAKTEYAARLEYTMSAQGLTFDVRCGRKRWGGNVPLQGGNLPL